MAHNALIQLAESRGLDTIIVFDGLSHSMVVHPMVHGEPLLTAQPYYYLSQLDAVGHVRFQDGEEPLPHSDLEYLADNYLFEYSLLNPSSRMTSRMTYGRFWKTDWSSFYAFADERHTKTVTLDYGNDPSVRSIEADEQLVSLAGWDLGRDSAQHALEQHLNGLSELLRTTIQVVVDPSEDRDGYVGQLSLIKPGYGLLTYFQAQELQSLSIRDVADGSNSVTLRSEGLDGGPTSIPVVRVTGNKEYDRVLLSYYFSGLKDDNPIKTFVAFYNVLEHYFGESLLNCPGTNEKDQLECVIAWLTDDAEIQSFLGDLDAETAQAMSAPIQTTSGVDLPALGGGALGSTCSSIAAWIYALRCAVVHSKKTRRGNSVSSIAPYSEEAANVTIALPIIRWLAQRCIVKDEEV